MHWENNHAFDIICYTFSLICTLHKKKILNTVYNLADILIIVAVEIHG